MDIAVIGVGNVGGALARVWAKKKHRVRLGVRDPKSNEVTALVSEMGPDACAGTPAAMVAKSAVVVLAVPWPQAKTALESCGDLTGRILVDCTNPLKADLSGLEIGHVTSAAEQIAGWARGAFVFKAFNQTGADNMASQAGYPMKPVMFIAGDDGIRKPAVIQLAADAGFDALDAGPLAAARLLEPLAMLWIHLAYAQKLGRGFAFALMKR